MVDQQGLRQDIGQSVAAILSVLVAVSPLVGDHRDLVQRFLDGLDAEHELGQVEAVEVAQVLEVGEASEEIAQSDQTEAHGGAGVDFLRGAELCAAGGTQPGPAPRGPASLGPDFAGHRF